MFITIWGWIAIVIMALYIIVASVSAYISYKETVSRNKYIETVHKYNDALCAQNKALVKQNNLLKEILKLNAPLGYETQED